MVRGFWATALSYCAGQGWDCRVPSASYLFLQTQEREAKAEMRRKAKELQQARRDAERHGKKAPGFGGFGSSAVSGGVTTMITETIIETEKPKVAPAPAR